MTKPVSLQLQVVTGQAAVQRCKAVIDFLEKDKPYFSPTINDKDLNDYFRTIDGIRGFCLLPRDTSSVECRMRHVSSFIPHSHPTLKSMKMHFLMMLHFMQHWLLGSPSGAMEAHFNKKKPEMVRRIFMSQQELYLRGN
ncbi:hypothetical protein POTOM_005100 [Populus tomentosa]|uniref:Uncharacterized protein n=1 Tax=Populus tomentosa TaxID=118781 RepID=A0A8X8ARK4_POPTO|nr:hypothetical protein POTOM_005100 [Populus tomentosa]